MNKKKFKKIRLDGMVDKPAPPAPEPEPKKKKVVKEVEPLPMPEEPWVCAVFAYVIFRSYLDRRLGVVGQKDEGLLLNKLSNLFAEWRKRMGDKQILDWMQNVMVQLATRMLLLNTPDGDAAFEEINLEEALKKWGWAKVNLVGLKGGKEVKETKKKLDW